MSSSCSTSCAPPAYAGFARLSRAARSYRDRGGEVRVVFRPFQVVPDAPAEGRPVYDVHKGVFGEEEARTIAADTSFGAADGIEAHFDRAVHVNTFEPVAGGAGELRARLAEARRAGVTSVPRFRFDTGRTISGAQPEDAFRAALEGPVSTS